MCAIGDSTYLEKVLTPLIPIMTSNTTPSGIASRSSVWANDFEAWHAFNRVSVRNNMWEADGKTSQWLQYEFPNNVKSYILEIDLSSAYPAATRYTDSYYLQVSSDGTNWENILTVNPTYDEIVQLTRYKIETPTLSKYYRWYFPLGCIKGTYRYTHVTRAQLYGR